VALGIRNAELNGHWPTQTRVRRATSAAVR